MAHHSLVAVLLSEGEASGAYNVPFELSHGPTIVRIIKPNVVKRTATSVPVSCQYVIGKLLTSIETVNWKKNIM